MDRNPRPFRFLRSFFQLLWLYRLIHCPNFYLIIQTTLPISLTILIKLMISPTILTTLPISPDHSDHTSDFSVHSDHTSDFPDNSDHTSDFPRPFQPPSDFPDHSDHTSDFYDHSDHTSDFPRPFWPHFWFLWPLRPHFWFLWLTLENGTPAYTAYRENPPHPRICQFFIVSHPFSIMNLFEAYIFSSRFKHKSSYYVAGWWRCPDVLHRQDVKADCLDVLIIFFIGI